MASADSPALPPGIESAGITLDFDAALAFIKDKAEPKLRDDVWNRSMVEAICTCFSRDEELLPIYLFAIKFLDVFWGLIFGRVNGPSPWHEWLIHPPSGTDDKKIDVQALYDSVKDFDYPEIAITESLRHFSPIKILAVTLPADVSLPAASKHSQDDEPLLREVKRCRVKLED